LSPFLQKNPQSICGDPLSQPQPYLPSFLSLLVAASAAVPQRGGTSWRGYYVLPSRTRVSAQLRGSPASTLSLSFPPPSRLRPTSTSSAATSGFTAPNRYGSIPHQAPLDLRAGQQDNEAEGVLESSSFVWVAILEEGLPILSQIATTEGQWRLGRCPTPTPPMSSATLSIGERVASGRSIARRCRELVRVRHGFVAGVVTHARTSLVGDISATRWPKPSLPLDLQTMSILSTVRRSSRVVSTAKALRYTCMPYSP
jgi:hypothetical protein